MRAAVTRAIGQIAVEEIDDPVPGPGEVLVRVVAAGVCRSDLTVLDGHGISPPLPAVLGHEGAGVVVALGAGVTSVAVGDHVVCSIVLSCGCCFQCHHDNLSLCEVGSLAAFGGGMMDGTSRLRQRGESVSQFFCQSSFAELAVVPERSAVPIRREVPLDIAAVLGCGAMTGIGAVTRRAAIGPMASVVVVGAGGVGLAAIMAASAMGARSVTAVDRSAAALELAATVGATESLSTEEYDQRLSQPADRGADLVIDTVGTPATLAAAFTATRPGGEVVLVGLADATSEVSLPMFGLCLQKRITGTYAGSVIPHVDIPNAIELFLAGRLPLDRLVTRRYGLDDIGTAIEDLREGRTVGRGVIQVDQSGSGS